MNTIAKKCCAVMLTVACVVSSIAAEDGPIGQNFFPDLFSPVFLGGGAFITRQGGAADLAVNPASGADAQRFVFDAGAAAILAGEDGQGGIVNLGALIPTKFAVFGASVRGLATPTLTLLDGETGVLLNAAASKELYPGMSVGLGLNLGAGSGDWRMLSADLGFRYNIGRKGAIDNITFALAAKGLGLSFAPAPWTFLGGVSADLLRIRSQDAAKEDPFVFTGLFDLGIPSFQTLTAKVGAVMRIAGIISLSASETIDLSDLADEEIRKPPFMPSIGLGVHFALKSSDARIAGGRLPTDGDITVAGGLKPLHHGVYAAGAGVTWTAGVKDNNPPVITVDYPETAYVSPNNDGVKDALEFPFGVTDQRYVSAWTMEITNENGEVVRTYRNKERRIETQGFWEVVKRLQEVKSGVVIPESLRWDGSVEDGSIAEDGRYFFKISAVDDNGNRAETEAYEVVIDNTPPAVRFAAMPADTRIFSPDGDGSKDTLVIETQTSSEDAWEGAFYDSTGKKRRTYSFEGAHAPTRVEWDGRGDSGEFLPDGVYAFRASSTDRAGNYGEAQLANIVVSTIKPEVRVSLADAWFSPNGDGVKDTARLNFEVPVKDGVTGWKLEILDTAGSTRRTVNGGSPTPLNHDFEGRDDRGTALPEGAYRAVFSVSYRNGFVSKDTSAPFTLDITPLLATVRAAYSAFSPNNDGVQDELPVAQTGSKEAAWTGVVRNADNRAAQPVRTMRFAGTPPAEWRWDGHTDSGGLAPDGRYVYELAATDRAGNSARAATEPFTLSTADTSVMLSTDLRAFSPNGDGVKDVVTVAPQIKTREGITSWQTEVRNAQGAVVRAWNGTAALPQTFRWDGKTDAGTAAPDGPYTARIALVYAQGDRPTAVSRPFTLDTVAPEGTVAPSWTVFSPNGDKKRDTLPLGVRSGGSDSWEAVIAGADGKPVKSWVWTGAAPAVEWDGSDEAGNTAPNGVYRFTLSSTDEAGNTTRREVSSITLDSRVPRVFFTESAAAIAPKPGSDARLTFTPSLSFTDGIESWEFLLKDASGNTVKSFNNRTENRAAPGPAIVWDGRNNNGAIAEGVFNPSLTVVWTKGDEAAAQGEPVTVDISGPVLDFVTTPEFFSPDNDGVDDELFMALGIEDISPVASWSLNINEPQTGRLFYRVEGKGMPAGRLVWDGRGNQRGLAGELVQAASDYGYTFRAADTLGNESALSGVIGIDVLVIRDGDNLKIAVPSIQFRSNEADFVGLATDVVSTNNRVLLRIAQILNKFRDYKVTVEGHANPTTTPGPAREREETQELMPLSERRAQAVVDILVRNGVSRPRLSFTGVGGRRTVASWEDENNRWKNRRVEFILIK